VSLETTTTFFAVALAVTFISWFASEKTLSIHTIVTTRREAFYWATILWTFALGTAQATSSPSDSTSATEVCAPIRRDDRRDHVAWRYMRLNPILAFLDGVHPDAALGASIGDFLSQPKVDGGLGLGTTTTSVIFLGSMSPSSSTSPRVGAIKSSCPRQRRTTSSPAY